MQGGRSDVAHNNQEPHSSSTQFLSARSFLTPDTILLCWILISRLVE